MNTFGVAQETINPLVPVWFDLAFSLVPLALIAVMIVGLVSIIRRYRTMTGLESFAWTAFVVAVPVLGTAAWFVIGRERYAELAGTQRGRVG